MKSEQSERLGIAGRADERALLAGAGSPAAPAALRSAVRAALEERLSPRGHRRALRRLLLALAGTLIAGSALAYGVVQVQRRIQVGVERAAPARSDAKRPARANANTPADADTRLAPPPAPAPTPPPAPVPAPPPGRRRIASRAVPPPGASTGLRFGGPELRSPQELLSAPDPEDSEDSLPRPTPPARLVIDRAGRRTVSLLLAGDRVFGQVRDTPVDLTISARWIRGTMGDHTVDFWLRGHTAEGTISGAPTIYTLIDTKDGHRLNAGALSQRSPINATIQIITSPNAVTWTPGCDKPLPLTAANHYQGRCFSGAKARVIIPAAWQALPPLPRLILLSLLLTERTPTLSGLFGTPDWAASP